MKYVAMIYGNQAKWDSFPAEEWPEAIAKQEAFNAKYRETGELLGAYGLADAANAQLIRRKDGVPAVPGDQGVPRQLLISNCWRRWKRTSVSPATTAFSPPATTCWNC